METWVDLVGSNVVAALAKESNIELTTDQITLLEKFAEHVDTASMSRNIRQRKLKAFESELTNTSNQVHDEVQAFNKTYINRGLQDTRELTVFQHAETYLPIVHFSIAHVPLLVIHVTRAYAHKQKGITYGIGGPSHVRRRPVPAVAQAANGMAEYCRQHHWLLSITELALFWMQTVAAIPPQTLIEQPPAPSHKRPLGPPLKRGGWKARRIDPANQPTDPKSIITANEVKPSQSAGQSKDKTPNQDTTPTTLKKGVWNGRRRDSANPSTDPDSANSTKGFKPTQSTDRDAKTTSTLAALCETEKEPNAESHRENSPGEGHTRQST